MFRLIAIDFSLLSPTSPCELSEREVTSPSNLNVVGALDNYSLVFLIFINFFGQLKDWVGQVLFLVSCPKGQVEKYVNVEAWYIYFSFRKKIHILTCFKKYNPLSSLIMRKVSCNIQKYYNYYLLFICN